jgi:GNAT superfamily N-acetyltransferase
MTKTEFESFMEISMKDHIRSQILAGNWTEENGPRNMELLRLELLPVGLDTRDHFFYSVKDETGRIAGGLWFMVQSSGDKRFIYVVDIQVFKEFRRRGYASQAFMFMEEKARELGIDHIYLNVFEHNVTARWMYEKLGYIGESDLMVKQLS